jgi:hypothetical protein
MAAGDFYWGYMCGHISNMYHCDQEFTPEEAKVIVITFVVILILFLLFIGIRWAIDAWRY